VKRYALVIGLAAQQNDETLDRPTRLGPPSVHRVANGCLTRKTFIQGPRKESPMADPHRCRFCDGEVSASALKCKHCGEWLKEREGVCRRCGTAVQGPWAEAALCAECDRAASVPVEATPLRAKLKKRTESAGEGCAIQGFGCLGGLLLIAIPIIGWVLGPVFILLMLVWGSRKSTKWSCGACGNPVADGKVRMCPSCRAQLKR
jgi:hypothetical protein